MDKRRLSFRCEGSMTGLEMFKEIKKFFILYFQRHIELHWCLLCSADSWLGNESVVWCGKTSPQKTEWESTSGYRKETKTVFKHVSPVESPVESNSSSEVEIYCQTQGDSGVTVRSNRDPSPLREGLGETLCCPLWGPVGLLRCHLHTMWQTPLVWPLFTLPHPLLFQFLRQMSEDPSLGTTTGKDGDHMDSTSHSFSLHHFTLISPLIPLICSVPFLYPFFLASGFQCSFCDYRTFTRVSPRHTPHVTLLSVAMLPEATCSCRLVLQNCYDTSPTTLSLSYSLSLLKARTLLQNLYLTANEKW